MDNRGYITLHINLTEQQYSLIKKLVDEINENVTEANISVSLFVRGAIRDFLKSHYVEAEGSDARANM